METPTLVPLRDVIAAGLKAAAVEPDPELAFIDTLADNFGVHLVREHTVPEWLERGWYDSATDRIVWESTRRPSDLEDDEDDYPVVYRLP